MKGKMTKRKRARKRILTILIDIMKPNMLVMSMFLSESNKYEEELKKTLNF